MTLAQSRSPYPVIQTPAPSPRSVTRTLRIDEDVEARVVGIADRDHLSFNLLANRALRKLVEWEDKAEKFGFIQVPTAIVERVFGTFSEGEARELGRQAGTNLLPEMVLFWFKKLDRNTAVKILELIGGYGKWFRIERTIDGRSEIVVLKHDRGPIVSAYNAELVKSLFGSLGAVVDTHETDGQVVANITYPASNFAAQHVKTAESSLDPINNEHGAGLKASPIAVRASYASRSSHAI
jgi:hypothetical protein